MSSPRREAGANHERGAMPDDEKPPAKDGTPNPDDDTLGEGGKKALEAERKARREAEQKLKDLEPLAKRAQELEDKQKSEVEKLTDKLKAAEERASKAELDRDRFAVALDKGLSKTQAKRLVGSNAEEFTADADELLADLGPREEGEKRPTPPSKPREHLKPANGNPDEGPEPDVRKVVEAIPRGF